MSAVDNDKSLKVPGDNPTIGLLLCKTKNNLIAKYALQDISKPIGVAGYKTNLVESLPKEFKGKLPSIKEIEAELSKNKVVKKESTKKITKKKK